MKIINGDSLEVLKRATENSVDAIVTDPPYGLSFMGKKWDYDVPSTELWKEALRVLKPGGHLLSFAGSRTYHRMAVNIEDAGFEIRDQIMWVYGSGFPKSHNIGKAVDKLQGNERVDLGEYKSPENTSGGKGRKFIHAGTPLDGLPRITKGNSPYEGWGTALKPAHEPIVVARKPLSEKTIAANVLKWGTGGINIDGCRVGTESTKRPCNGKGKSSSYDMASSGEVRINGSDAGRFPANLIHDGSQEVLELFPETKSGSLKAGHKRGSGVTSYDGGGGVVKKDYGNDQGSAARFFYCAKASKKDRNEGLEGFEEKVGVGNYMAGAKWINDPRHKDGGYMSAPSKPQTNSHPTVKPTKLMQYLVRLVTPVGGTVLDPFMGSGSTGKACVLEGFDFIGIDLDPEYCKIAEARIDAV